MAGRGRLPPRGCERRSADRPRRDLDARQPAMEPTAPVPVDWTVARDPDLGATSSPAAPRRPRPERDWTVHVDVDGPRAGDDLLVRLRGDRRDVASRPDEDARRRRTRTTCGSRWCPARSSTPASSMRMRASPNATDLDFLLHLGDYIYEAAQNPPASQTPGADIGRPFEPRNECVTLADYRTRYAQYRRDPDTQALHAMHPLIATLDDHELADGAFREGSLEHHRRARRAVGRPQGGRPAGALGVAARPAAGPGRPDARLPRRQVRRPRRPLPHRHADASRRPGRPARRCSTRPIAARPRAAARGCSTASTRRRPPGGILGNSSVLGHIWHETLGTEAHRPLARR